MAPNFRLIWQEAFSLFSPVMLLLLSGVAVNGAEYDATAKPATIPLEVGVDQRVELISIIFRLAGNPEYRQGRLKGYLQDIEKHFEPARAHPVIALAKQLRAKRGVSFDAPMSLAVHLKDAESLAERVPFAPHPVGLDNRWQLAEVREFLVQARDFVQVAKFGEFCQAQQPLYEETAARARRLLITEGRLEWFNEFFGARPGARFRMAPALVNGGSCYGARVQLDKEEELYCILGVWRTDTGDKPVFDREVLDTVAHEFCHSYVNPHVYARAKELEAAGKKLFAQVQERMRRMAYGNWQTMMHESVVRAAVVRYLDATQGRLAATKQVWEERDRQNLLCKDEKGGERGDETDRKAAQEIRPCP